MAKFELGLLLRAGAGLALALALGACTDDGGTSETAATDDATESGDGDGDGDTGDGDGDTGDGDGDTGDGDGDTGDGDGDTGDGDGDTGDGDGDTGDGDGDTGDGDGDTGDGDGDGDGDCSGASVDVCESEPPSDPFMIDALAIVGDCLEVDVTYSGGCEDHAFSSCWDQSFAESDPVQAWLWIDHDAMNDACEALIQDTWIIDLSALRESWQDAYQSQNGTIILHVGPQDIQYDF